MSKNVLLIGSGGREHALARKLGQSLHLGKLYTAPGNGGTSDYGENVAIPADNISGLLNFAQKRGIDQVIVGPEGPLAAGIVDEFQKLGIPVFGPSQRATQLESSKAHAKNFMALHHIPTADFIICTNYDAALNHVQQRRLPFVVKADGLALGKGAFPCQTVAGARQALKEIMVERVFGDSGNRVVIEDFLDGQEISIHAFCDGNTAVLFPPSQDHKAIFDNDQGPNTGGMGSFAPVPWVTPSELAEIQSCIVNPVIESMKKNGAPYIGCLYPGLMMTVNGPQVLEFNVRFGDPETQVYVPLLKTDLLDVVEACINGRLAELSVEWNPGYAVCVVLASGGYPDAYKKGFPITGIREAEKVPGVVVFHAGTAFDNGRLVTSGGRVLGVTAVGDTLSEAIDRAYQAVNCIRFEGMHYRHDIGAKASNQ